MHMSPDRQVKLSFVLHATMKTTLVIYYSEIGTSYRYFSQFYDTVVSSYNFKGTLSFMLSSAATLLNCSSLFYNGR